MSNFLYNKIFRKKIKPMKALTFGQIEVGLTFNPSGDPDVIKIKQMYADIIDHLNDLRNSSASQNQKRWCSVGITEAVMAQMAAVKALTWKDQEFDFNALVVEQSKETPVLVFFSSPTCHPCKVQKPLVEELSVSRGDFRMIYIDGTQHGALAAEHGVRGVPDLRLWKAGKEIWKGMSARALEDFLDSK